MFNYEDYLSSNCSSKILYLEDGLPIDFSYTSWYRLLLIKCISLIWLFIHFLLTILLTLSVSFSSLAVCILLVDKTSAKCTELYLVYETGLWETQNICQICLFCCYLDQNFWFHILSVTYSSTILLYLVSFVTFSNVIFCLGGEKFECRLLNKTRREQTCLDSFSFVCRNFFTSDHVIFLHSHDMAPTWSFISHIIARIFNERFRE